MSRRAFSMTFAASATLIAGSMRPFLKDRIIQAIHKISHAVRGTGGDFYDLGQAVLLVAGIDAFRRIAAEEILIEDQPRARFQNRTHSFRTSGKTVLS